MKFKLTKPALGIVAAFTPLAAAAEPVSLIALAVSLAAAVEIGTTAALVLWGASATLTAYSAWGSTKARRKARKEAAFQKARFNASLEDRAVNVLDNAPPWRIVYGRAPVGCSIHAVFTKDKVGYRDNGSQYTHKDALHYLVCVFAAHQCAAWHDLRIDNQSAGPFDPNGWSMNPEYRLKDRTRIYREALLASGASIVETSPIKAGSVLAYASVGWNIDAQAPAAVSVTVSPDRLTVTNPQAYPVNVTYTLEVNGESSLRVWFHDGHPDQAADATLLALFPDKWTVDHRLRGRCYFVIMLDLENPKFQSGPPQFTADLSGKLVYDPRTLTTIFSQNNAVCVRDFLTAKWGAEATVDEIDDTLCAASAYACDTSTSFEVDSYTDQLVFEFTEISDYEGWTTSNATLSGAGLTYRNLVGTGEKPAMIRESISVIGADSRYLRVSLIRYAGSGWTGKCYYKTALHGYSENYRKDLPSGGAYYVSGNWPELVFDMHSLTAGAGDWKNSTVTGVKLVFGLGTGDNFSIEYIAFGAHIEGLAFGPKYTLNGSFTTDQGREEVLNEMAASMAGFVTNSGKWNVVAGAWTVPVMDLTEDDLDGQIELVQADAGLEELTNGSRGMYFKEGEAVAVDYKPYQNATLLAEDGEPLWDEESFPFTNNESRARNLARIAVERTRNGQILTFPAKLHAWPITVGDRVRVTNSEYGLTTKAYRVLDWNFGVSSPVALTLQEDTSGTYDETDTALSDPTPNTDLPNPAVVQSVSDLVAESGNAQLQRGTDGTVRARVLVGWEAATDPYLTSGSAIVEIAWRRIFVDEPDAWRIHTTPATDIGMYLENVRENEVLIIRARYRNNAGEWGDPAFLYHTVLGKTQAPSNVTGLNAVMVEGGVQFSWNPGPEADYLETEIRHGASWAAGTKIFAGNADNAFWPRPALGTYAIWAKHRDTSLIESAAAASGTIEVLAGGAITWASISGRPALYRVASRGYYSTTHQVESGFYNGETNALLVSYGFMYAVIKINRSTGVFTSVGAYDTYNTGPSAATAMAAALNAIGSDHIVVVHTVDEPQANRMYGALPAAMYRCGASRAVYGSPEFKRHPAYVLVGIPGCGEGQGYEAYQGEIDEDTNAWCDVTMQVLNGNYIISGNSATPKTLRDYAYTGDYDATKDVALVGSSGMLVNGNQAKKLGPTGGWDAHVYSPNGYQNGAFASARLMYNAADYALMWGLNSDPLTNTSYDSIDYAIYPTGSGISRYNNGAGTSISAVVAVAGDILTVKYDGHRMFYMHNGTVIAAATQIVGPNLVLHFDSSFANIGGGLSEIQFGPLSSLNGIDTPQIIKGAAADVLSVSPADTDIYTNTYGYKATLASISYTPDSDCDITVLSSGHIEQNCYLQQWSTYADITDTDIINVESTARARNVDSVDPFALGSLGLTKRYSCLAGVPKVFKLIGMSNGSVAPGGANSTFVRNVQFRIEVIKV